MPRVAVARAHQELLRRLQANHRQLVKRVKESKPPEEWSMESDKAGVVDAWRLYAMDSAYEELLTLPKVFPIVNRAVREGRGRPAHAGGGGTHRGGRRKKCWLCRGVRSPGARRC